MLTNRKSTKTRRFADLAVMGEVLFHAGDLANMWLISNKNTLHKTLSRYVESGLLFRIHKGFYSLTEPKKLTPYLLAVKALHGFVYVSCESILYEHGIINQKPLEVTVVSSASKRYEAAHIRCRSRKLDVRFLHNNAGIISEKGIRIASVSRAVADMLYFNPSAYFDAASSQLINWQEVRTIAATIGYTIHMPRS